MRAELEAQMKDKQERKQKEYLKELKDDQMSLAIDRLKHEAELQAEKEQKLTKTKVNAKTLIEQANLKYKDYEVEAYFQ